MKTVKAEPVLGKIDLEVPTYSTCKKQIQTRIIADSPEFIPIYKHNNDACCDLKANLPNGPLHIQSMETVKIDVGFKMQLPIGYEAQIRCRSGMGAKGILVTNSPGTIDEGYLGRMCVLLTNLNKEPYTVKHLDRIAQMALKPVYQFDFVSVDTLDETERAEGGFGSTGI